MQTDGSIIVINSFIDAIQSRRIHYLTQSMATPTYCATFKQLGKGGYLCSS